MFDTVDNPGYCHYTNCNQLAVVDGASLGPCLACGYQGCASHMGVEHHTCLSLLKVVDCEYKR